MGAGFLSNPLTTAVNLTAYPPLCFPYFLCVENKHLYIHIDHFYLSVLCNLGLFGAILSDLSLVRNDAKWPPTTQSRQVHAKQEVSQLYFIIHNSMIYF